jgi:transcriptional regulator with XRE-family HTH domain
MASRMTAKTFIGNEIRRARDAKGISRAKLAKLLIVSESLIAAWESGRQAILVEHMKRLLGISEDGAHGNPLLEFPPEFIIRMIEELVNGEALPEWEDKWLVAEKLATMLWWFEIYLIPGLLQTPEYARAVLSDDVTINKRLDRQKILTAEAPASLVAVISESALRHNVGGPEVMAAQLDHLAECATQDNITVSIIPIDSAMCAKFRGTFIVATLENGKDVAYTDSPISGQVAEQPEEIAILRRLFDQYRADALRTNESLSLIRKVAEQWKT